MRAAVTSYFTAANIPYVGTIYSARPTVVNEQDYEQTLMGQIVASTPNGSRAVLVVNIPNDDRQRRADTGRGAVNDSRIHDVVMEIFFACVAGDATQAQTDYDGIVDAMVTLIRHDPTMGGGSWSAGEYTTGISHRQSMPYTDEDGLIVFIPGIVRFEAWEWIAGAA